ncbi:hypothetical protein LFYK43_08230 [Ligilactobacillus salitolerans]|uniref:Uncharacterized protein n=2 Tax=Ligilactobacillus salitolerans TaxID=1808352 RepID=A0A401IS75_9LACO|nr:hypothetical protein LFYK43_08230 [Ligilactobacillus salitolerans]
MLSMSQQTPQINFHMTTGDDERDAKIMAAGTELYDAVLHLQIYPQQVKLGLIDENVSELYFQGVLAQLQPEQPDQVDEWMVLRTVKLLDALVFFADKQDQIRPKLQELYPQCLAAAEKLAQGLLEKPVSGPQKMRAAIVKLWRGFDEQLSAWGQNPLGLNDFISLEPVLSERQTRLFVSQLFEVYHSSLQDNLHFKPAYIVRYKSDRQNSSILPEPAGDKEKFFRSFYAAKIGEILPQIHVDYLQR